MPEPLLGQLPRAVGDVGVEQGAQPRPVGATSACHALWIAAASSVARGLDVGEQPVEVSRSSVTVRQRASSASRRSSGVARTAASCDANRGDGVSGGGVRKSGVYPAAG